MNILYLLVPLALLLGFWFLYSFIRMVLGGQYDDLETPAHRILLEDELVHPKAVHSLERSK